MKFLYIAIIFSLLSGSVSAKEKNQILAGNCDYSWQNDSAGNRCGGRSAEERKGGYDPYTGSRGEKKRFGY